MAGSVSSPNRWKRRVVLGLLVVGLPLAWKGCLLEAPGLLHRGDGAPPGLFRFHALGVVKAGLGYPRSLEATVPAPLQGSNASAQLQLMGWWDGRAWTSRALAMGRVDGRALRPRLGSLALVDVLEVTPARDYNGPTLCQVDYRVRWDLPEADRAAYQARALIGLRLPAGLGPQGPGQELTKQVTLERTALGWRLQDAEHWQSRESGRGGSRYAWLSPLL